MEELENRGFNSEAAAGNQEEDFLLEEAFEKLLGRIHPGAVVLLHSTSSTNAQILDELLTKWEEMGYTFRSLEQLVQETGNAS